MKVKRKIITLVKIACYIIAPIASIALILFAVKGTIFEKVNISAAPTNIFDKQRVSSGYTLFPSILSKKDKEKLPGKKSVVYLIDIHGNPVHKWYTEYTVLSAKLKKDGNLVVACSDPKLNTLAGSTGVIQELDWKGNVVWEYINRNIHHDFDILPNGNIAVIAWEAVPDDIASRIKGGIEGTEMKGKILGDVLLEIDRNKHVVWEWHGNAHLDIDKDIIIPFVGRGEWMHTNSIQYIPKDPIRGGEAYLISPRELSTLMMIDKKTGEIFWRSAPDMVSIQHDATLLPNGNILVFDNGVYKQFTKETIEDGILGSRVIEINPKTNKVVWEYKNGKSIVENVAFTAFIVSGTQRLPNGNTLIIDGPGGYIFEVTHDKKLVWTYRNPYGMDVSRPYPYKFIFKARKYAADEINWPVKLPKPL